MERPGPRAVTALLPFRRGRAQVARVVWLGLLLAASSVVVVAALLTPDPVGHGTHTQLGLPPCGFLLLTGYPCAGCGLTTSFAHMIRLDVVAAAHANPFGIMLFLVTVVLIPLSAAGFVRSWPLMEAIDRLRADRWAILLAVTSLLTWGVRVVAMVR